MARRLPLPRIHAVSVKRRLVVFLLSTGVILLRAPLYGDSSAEELCEKLHVASLKKAKQALTDGKTDEAIRILLEAEAISMRCASLVEPESPRGQEANVVASVSSTGQVSAKCCVRIRSISWGSTDWPAFNFSISF